MVFLPFCFLWMLLPPLLVTLHQFFPCSVEPGPFDVVDNWVPKTFVETKTNLIIRRQKCLLVSLNEHLALYAKCSKVIYTEELNGAPSRTLQNNVPSWCTVQLPLYNPACMPESVFWWFLLSWGRVKKTYYVQVIFLMLHESYKFLLIYAQLNSFPASKTSDFMLSVMLFCCIVSYISIVVYLHIKPCRTDNHLKKSSFETLGQEPASIKNFGVKHSAEETTGMFSMLCTCFW